MTAYDYIGFGLVVVPLIYLSLKRGQIGGRTFTVMAADLQAQGHHWDKAKLRSALMKWPTKPSRVVEMCENEAAKEIVMSHATRATARMKPWKTAATIWMFVGIAGMVAWLNLESKGPSKNTTVPASPSQGVSP